MIRRRSYNYTDGLDADGQLNEYIRHIGSAIFAIPPAPEEGHYIAQALFT
jgi:deferrochelatase/peroxidase EfeB